MEDNNNNNDDTVLSETKDEEQEETEQEETLVPTGMLPFYLSEAFGDLYAQDGLVVLGKGLGWLSLLASFVRFYADVEEGHAALVAEEEKEEEKEDVAQQHQQDNDDKKKKRQRRKVPLVLVLGLKEGERSALVNILETWGTPPELMPTMITNESGQSKDRAALYNKGGVLCITSRILIVDLLTSANVAGAVQSDMIDGLLVAHAEQVTEQSTEAFIIRIFQSQKQPFGSGFVKAFTQEPDQLMSGFAKVDKILKALHVRQLYLYPRFHHMIRNELEQRPPAVTELHQPLSRLQQEMQAAIAAAVQSCIRELKSSTTLLEWNNNNNINNEEKLTVENCVTTQFDRAISKQLENDWHRLKPQTKQLVQDLKTLRTLFHNLVQYDCVSFYKFLNNLKSISVKSRQPSLWLLTPAAHVLFAKAKERVYTIHQPKPTKAVPHPVAQLNPVLEENPKWKLLQQVLMEIQQEDQVKKKGDDDDDDENNNNKDDDDDDAPTSVLVMVKDDKTLESVKAYLVDGRTRTMTLRWWRVLEQINDRSRAITTTAGATTGAGAAGGVGEENRLLLEEEGRVRRVLFGNKDNKDNKDNNKKTTTAKRGSQTRKKKRLNEVPDYVKKKRRIAIEKGRGELTHQTDDLEREAVLDEAVEAAEHELETARLMEPHDDDDSRSDDEDALFDVQYPNELRVVIKSYSSIEGDEALLLLQDIRPRYVVLYDAEVSFIRSVEIYAALSHRAKNRVRVYFLMFEASAEEKSFMKSMEREQNAFERLIHHKKTMPPPVLQSHATQEMQQAIQQGGVMGSYMGGTLPLAFDTRRGRGKADGSKERRDIAVDVREFRSALPSILHQGGMRLAPVTLTVGDFVLSNVHCVERKSISDLFGSFASGRLYSQAEAMVKCYKCPCLLIEFDPAKSFCLQSVNDLGADIRTDSVSSKMALLVMHFPKLRILWSRSPHETLRIFRELKKNHDEVDVDRALEAGRNESVEALLQPNNNEDDEEEEDEINEAAREMLLRLPGVNVHSARKIMQECDSLAELSEMSRDELRRIAGPVTGQKLFTFFRQKLAAT